MTSARLILRSLVHFWRTSLSVLLGVMAGTAVIGGALLVGDSVRGSLRQMTLDRLGGIDHALSGHRFFREDLASALVERPDFAERFAAAAPAIAMQGAVERRSRAEPGPAETAEDVVLRAGRVNVYGVDERLWALLDQGGVEPPSGDEIVVNRRLAEQLSRAAAAGRDAAPLAPGDALALRLELPSSIPRDTLLGEREQTATELGLHVAGVLDEAAGAGRLELNPNQQLPLNAFVSLETLQRGLDLARVRPSRAAPLGKPARVNALFFRARDAADGSGAAAPQAAAALTAMLSEELTTSDLVLRVRRDEERGYLSIESEQQILSQALASAAQRAADGLRRGGDRLTASPAMVYLANEIAHADAARVSREDQSGYSMYSVIAGLEFPLEPPFSLVSDGTSPGPGEILLTEWLAHDLRAQVGDDVTVAWHVVGSHGELPEEVRTFRVAGVLPLETAADRGLTPEVEGITDARTFSDWTRQPFPLKTERITDRDEEFWDRYRAMPKAFVSLETAQELWQSRYGRLTSFRVAGPSDEPLDALEKRFLGAFFGALDPRETGLVVQPVKRQGLDAAAGTTDFAGLFLGFSFFLILSATILIGLLFRLGIERRGAGVGLLSAVGFTPRQVQRVFLLEGLVVLLAGGLVGLFAAVGYARLMVYGLTTWWVGAIGTRFLNVHVEPASLAIGFGISVAVAGVAVWWALRNLKQLPARDLLAGATQLSLSRQEQRRRSRGTFRSAAAAAGMALATVVAALMGLIPPTEAFLGINWQAVAFFLVGAALLWAGLSFLAAWLDADRSLAVRGRGLAGIGRLGMRNASRSRTRSVLTVGLIASATFVLVAVAAGHRDPTAEAPDLHSGNGGFTLVAESSTPILADLNTEAGRVRLNLDFDPDAADPQERRRAELVERMTVVPFRVQPGEDASCLNLYQTRLPTVLGVPRRMIERGGFKFVGTRDANPWTRLEACSEAALPGAPDSRRPAYPVFGDLNSLQYSLHKGLGDTIAAPDEANPEHLLEVAGMFDGSVFQGVLLMSEENFQRVYPDRAGYQYFLIEAPPEDAAELSNLLETRLADYGFDAEPVAERIAGFLAVQNTYLSTFQALGGLGLLLGTLGLATVMLRNVLERRSELALLRAVGFRNASLAWLVLWENAFLLAWGLAAGTASALLAMWPHLSTVGADVPWAFTLAVLAGVFAAGTLAALVAVSEAVRTPIVTTLRSE